MAEADKCPNCGGPLPEGASLCVQCGVNVKTGERYGTKVDGEKKPKPKKVTKAHNPGLIMALLIIVAAVVGLNLHENQKAKKFNEIRVGLRDGIARAERALEKDDPVGTVEILSQVREEIEARKEEMSVHKGFVKELEAMGEEVDKKKKGAYDAVQEKRDRDDRQAKEKAELATKIRQGYILFQGKWYKPAQLRSRGYREVQGAWRPVSELLKYGWAYVEGDYRSPTELYGRKYRKVEGTWRKEDYVRQIRGDVLVKGASLTESQALSTMPSIVYTRSQPDGWIGRVTRLPEGGIRVEGAYQKKLTGQLDVTQRTFLFERRPPEPLLPRRGGDRTRWLRPGIRLLRIQMAGDFYKVRTPPAGGRNGLAGYVIMAHVKVPTESAERKISWKTKAMVDSAQVRVEPLAPVYKRTLELMRKTKDPAQLLKLARDWDTREDLSHWPNHRWQAMRCRDMVDLVRKGIRPATPAEASRALALPRPVDPRLPGARRVALKPRPAARSSSPAPKPSKPVVKPVVKPRPKPVVKPRPRPVVKPTPKPVVKPAPKPIPASQMVTVIVAKAKVVEGKERKLVAEVTRGTKLPFFKRTSAWTLVEVSTPQGKRRGWISTKEVRAPGEPAPAPAQWATVATNEAKLQVSQGGKWIVAAVLKKGHRANVLQSKGKYHWVETTVNGKTLKGWLAKQDAK